MPIAHAISTAWISTGGTGAQNYDEFADDAEITAIIAANPNSALAIEMPHLAPDAVAERLEFADALADAADRLHALKTSGRLRRESTVVAPYRVSTADSVSYGMFCLVDTSQISSAPDDPGLVIRNEDVFADKVGERTALLRYLEHLLSPVLLLHSGQQGELRQALANLIDRLDAPAVSDLDQHGQRHDVWLVGPGPDQDALLGIAGSAELIVADGNHRSLAAQEAGIDKFLAVITSPDSVTIQPYQRLVRHLDRPVPQLLEQLRAHGAIVEPSSVEPPRPGSVILYAGSAGTYRIGLPDLGGSVAERIDHAVLQRVLFERVLQLDPGDKAISYIGGDYPTSWLIDQVDNGHAALALLLAPVAVSDFVAVNLDRAKMPRKSTWFTPKARTGLVVAELDPSASRRHRV